MSVSVVFSTRIPVNPPTPLRRQFGAYAAPRAMPTTVGIGTGMGMGKMIECSSRPQKKATAHHRKTRPRKSQPWDIRRGPAVYPPLPPLPADWTIVGTAENADAEPNEMVLVAQTD